MPFQLSPGVNVTEIDLTTVVPAVATSTGAIAGVFNWGPINERVLIDSETKLVNTFGKPNSNNAETFFTAANFLSYTNSLYVVRTANTTNALNPNTGTMSAVANNGAILNQANETVMNHHDFELSYNPAAGINTFDANTRFVARWPGALGNSLKVSVVDSASQYISTVYMDGGQVNSTFANASLTFTTSIGSNAIIVTCTSTQGNVAANVAASNAYLNYVVTQFAQSDYLTTGNSTIGTQYMQFAGNSAMSTNSTTSYCTIYTYDNYMLNQPYIANTTQNTTLNHLWEYFDVIGTPPGQTDYQAQFGNTSAQDGVHVVVVDRLGKFTGVPGTVLETYQNLSRATDAKTVGGQSNYYQTVINQNSQYVWSVRDRNNSPSNTAVNLANSTSANVARYIFSGGTDGYSEQTAPLYVLTDGYDMFASAEDVDVSLILQGKPTNGSTAVNGMTVSNFQLANYIIDNIVEDRKDCVVFITPDDGVVTSNYGNEATALVNWRNAVHSSSYAVIDSGYKYQYDRYNDVYRYIPTNGDIAGLCARTDNTRDPWWSPAGLNRGQIKNIVKLRYNPTKADRDLLYPNGINPVVTLQGQGTVLFGDKTAQSKPSAFDHINVRRLFIVLEKAIATAAKFTLFEFNDEFTRAQFKNLVTPYLRDVQGRRGITDFLVVCDATNNTPEVVDGNQFVGDIYIKPARSINYIQLNFVAVATGVQFSEVVGQF
jgi:phage tail sheath protein FI